MARDGRGFPARLGTLLTLAAVLVFTGAPAGAEGARRAHKPVSFPFFDVPIPGPGHVTVGVYSITFPRAVSGGLPKGLSFNVPEARTLSPSVRVLTMTQRVKTRRSVRFALVVVAIHQRKAGQRAARQSARIAIKQSEPPVNTLLGLDDDDESETPTQFSIQCGHCKKEIYFKEDPNPYGAAVPDSFCDKCSREGHLVQQGDWNHNPDVCPACHKSKQQPVLKADVVENVDKAPPKMVKPLVSSLDDLFKPGAFDKPPPENNGKGDPNLDTGHYDDGHAFGWNVKKESDAERLVYKTLSLLVNERMDQLVAEIEARMAADVDGDGEVGQSPTQQQVDTTVGAPIITGGGGGP